MRPAPLLFVLAICSVPMLARAAQETWPPVLSQMPLPAGTTELNRTNCVRVMLAAFRSNAVVKALIFLPGATDEFYMFRRAQAQLTNNTPTLLEAISALTNQTRIRATFRSPFLLLHTDNEPLEAKITAQRQGVVEKMKKAVVQPHVEFNDADWDSIQPLLKKKMGADVKPWRYSLDSFHFYRMAFAAWNLTEWEMLQAVALASQTCVAVESRSLLGLRTTVIRFECEQRLDSEF
jgi:hypothetical protein